MNPIITGVAVGVLTTIITSFLYAIVRRFSIKTKEEGAMEEIRMNVGARGEGQ